MVAPPVSDDGFLGGQLRLTQPREGHRAGSDAILLAAAAPADVAGLALDVGSGVGSAGLALAALRPGLRFRLVENDLMLAALAGENIERNDLAERGSVYRCDALDRASRQAVGLEDGSASLVITNPPFFEEGRVRHSSDSGKRSAHVMGEGADLGAWVLACLALLAEGGILTMIHRPESLPAILVALGRRAGDIALKPIQPHADKSATRILLRARKSRRGPLGIAPALILHDAERFTPESAALHRGAALIKW
ncbi:MAG: methyltransferase [Methylovirgula sp.]|jgi:tRNA1(Val) A37 N6-methylase TrmN6